MFGKPKTLIVVYKDEMLANQVRKLVETSDDVDEENIVGTKDDSVKVVPWTEKVWLTNKKAGNIDAKVLFLGDIKGVDKLIPVLDVKFDKFGVKYGWAGDQAVVFADTSAVKSREEYDKFLEEIRDLPIPDKIKNANRQKEDKTAEKEPEVPPVEDKKHTEPVEVGPVDKALDAYVKGLNAFSAFFAKAGNDAAERAEEFFRDKSAVETQMLFYGIIQLYNDHLEEYMNS